MFNHIKNGINWAVALSEYEKGNFRNARDRLLEMKGKRIFCSERFALLGAIFLSLGEFQEAKEMFFRAKNEYEPSRPEYKDYVDVYCEYYLSSLEGQEAKRISFLEKSIRMQAPPLIKRWLPLS